MEMTVKTYKLKQASFEMMRMHTPMVSSSETIRIVIGELRELDESFGEIAKKLNSQNRNVKRRTAEIKTAGETLFEIADLYKTTEDEIAHYIFSIIPEDKKLELHGRWKKLVIEDTDHKVEIVDPLYFQTHLKDRVEEISRESVAMDFLVDLYKTMTGAPDADEAQIRFTLTSQALAQYELLSFVAESFGIDEEVLNGACITPEFLAYGILIDGVPMLEYAMDHPDEFNNKDAPIARKEINKREREERKKAKKSA